MRANKQNAEHQQQRHRQLYGSVSGIFVNNFNGMYLKKRKKEIYENSQINTQTCATSVKTNETKSTHTQSHTQRSIVNKSILND